MVTALGINLAYDFKVFKSNQLQSGRKAAVLLADSATGAFLLESGHQLVGSYVSLFDHVNERICLEMGYTNAQCRGRVVIDHAFVFLERQFQSLHTELK